LVPPNRLRRFARKKKGAGEAFVSYEKICEAIDPSMQRINEVQAGSIKKVCWKEADVWTTLQESPGRLFVNGRLTYVLAKDYVEQTACTIREILRYYAKYCKDPRYHHVSVESEVSGRTIHVNGLPDRFLRPVLVRRPPERLDETATLTDLLDDGVAYLISGLEQIQCTEVYSLADLPEYSSSPLAPLELGLYHQLHPCLQQSLISFRMHFPRNNGASRHQYFYKNLSHGVRLPHLDAQWADGRMYAAIGNFMPGPTGTNVYNLPIMRTGRDAGGFLTYVAFGPYQGLNHEDSVACDASYVARLRGFGEISVVRQTSDGRRRVGGGGVVIGEVARATLEAMLAPDAAPSVAVVEPDEEPPLQDDGEADSEGGEAGEPAAPRGAGGPLPFGREDISRLLPTGFHRGDVRAGDVLLVTARRGEALDVTRAAKEGCLLGEWIDSALGYCCLLYRPMNAREGTKLFAECQKMTISQCLDFLLRTPDALNAVMLEIALVSRMSPGLALDGAAVRVSSSWGVNVGFRAFASPRGDKLLLQAPDLTAEELYGSLRRCPGRPCINSPFFSPTGLWDGIQTVIALRLGALPAHDPRDHATARLAPEQPPFAARGGWIEPMATPHAALRGFSAEGFAAAEHVESGQQAHVLGCCASCDAFKDCFCGEEERREPRVVGAKFRALVDFMACCGHSLKRSRTDQGCSLYPAARELPSEDQRRVLGRPEHQHTLHDAAKDEMDRSLLYCPLSLSTPPGAQLGCHLGGSASSAVRRALTAFGATFSSNGIMLCETRKQATGHLTRLKNSLSNVIKWLQRMPPGGPQRRAAVEYSSLYIDVPQELVSSPGNLCALALVLDYARDVKPVKVFQAALYWEGTAAGAEPPRLAPTSGEPFDKYRTIVKLPPPLCEVDQWVRFYLTPYAVQEALRWMPLDPWVPLGRADLCVPKSSLQQTDRHFVDGSDFVCTRTRRGVSTRRTATLLPNPYALYPTQAKDLRIPGTVEFALPRQAGRRAMPVALLRSRFRVTVDAEAARRKQAPLTPHLCPYGVFEPWTRNAGEQPQERVAQIESLSEQWCDGCHGCRDAVGADVVQVRELKDRRVVVAYTDEQVPPSKVMPCQPEVHVLREAAGMLVHELQSILKA
jgi:hypothetical protein